jgi:hypothetical protein
LRRAVDGIVCYIPGLSPRVGDLEHEWAIRLVEGSLRVMVYSPEEAQPGGRIVLIARNTDLAPLSPGQQVEKWPGWINEGEADPAATPRRE